MSNKVKFATNQYVQEEIAKAKLESDQQTNIILENIKNTHSGDITKINNEILELKETVNNDLSEAVKETNKNIEDMKVSIGKDLENLSKNILVENIEYRHPEYSQLLNVKDALDNLLYTDLEVLVIATYPFVNEVGSTLNDVVLSWEFNRIINTQSIDGVQIHKDSRLYKYPTSITTDKTINISVNDFVKDYTKPIKFKFLNGVYYGASNATSYDSAFILNLSKELSESKEKTFTVNAENGNYIYYCIPDRFGIPLFTVCGIEGGFSKVAIIEFTNSCGYTEPYAIWKSNNPDLGQTTVIVK